MTDPETISRCPPFYRGKVVYEGELGIMIGRPCKDASKDGADVCNLGFTCVNDITAVNILDEDLSFPKWARSKSFDAFSPFGPVIATGVRSEKL